MNISELENKLKKEGDKAGVYPIYTNKQGILLVYLMIPSNKKYGGLSPQMGKGGVDPGETAQQAATREGFEELGLREDNIVSIKYISNHLHMGRRSRYNLAVFVATVKDPNNFDTPGYESGWAGWMAIDDAIAQTRPEQVQFLNQIKQDYTVTLTKESAQTVIQDKINKYQDAVGHYDKMIKQGGDVHILRKEIETTKAEISNLNAQLQLAAQGIGAAQDSEHDSSNLVKWQQGIRPAIDTIKKHCKPYLNAIGNDITQYQLYRGLRGSNANVMTGRVRLTGRISQASGATMHDGLNKYFKQHHGGEFRNALFASSNPDMAKDYGNLFLIFPRGPFTYLWSPKIQDLYYEQEDILDAIDDDYLAKQMSTYDYQTTGLQSAILSGNEIMIRCEAYYGINMTALFDRNDYDDDSTGDAGAINNAIALIQELL